ncbi:MAG TPA: hypothetical protein PK698_01825 [Bacilli bacterium]|jgi:hypothetical protein|nr:hypothetical protein [Bacilli bacterium]
MKRQDIITKLINEGFSQKTLVNLTDKQLKALSDRILSEQIGTISTTAYGTTSGDTPVLNIPKTDTATINKAKAQKKTFATYEGEVKENELKGAPKKKIDSEREKVLKRINFKIDSKIKKNECIKSEIDLLKNIGEPIPEKAQKYYDKKMSKKKEMVGEPVEQTTKPMTNIPVVDGNNKKIKTWVNKIVENKFVTSKNEIIDLIQKKLTEQEVLVKPKPAEPEIETEPDTKTRPDIDPDDPFRDPFPDVDPNPKARTRVGVEKGDPEIVPDYPVPDYPGYDPENPTPDPNIDDPFKDPFPDVDPNPKAGNKNIISAEDAKNKIITLMKSYL